MDVKVKYIDCPECDTSDSVLVVTESTVMFCCVACENYKRYQLDESE